jgi:hypothetical protein
LNTLEMVKSIREKGELIKSTPISDEIGTIVVQKYKVVNSFYTIVSRETEPIIILYGFESTELKRALKVK